MRISRALEPTVIAWHNLGTSMFKVFLRRILSYSTTLLILAVNFMVIIGLQALDGYIKDSIKRRFSIGNADSQLTGSKLFAVRTISICVSLVIQVVNRIMLAILKLLTEFERWSDLTKHYASYSFKNVVAVFTTTNLLIVISHLLLHRDELSFIWGKGSLINDVFFIIVGDNLLDPLFIFLDPVYLYRRLKRCRLARKAQKKTCTALQKDANDLFEGPELDLADSYANLVSTFWMALFFTPVFPVAAPITCLAFVSTYWLQKTLLLRRFARPRAYSGSICFLAMYLLRFSPFVLMVLLAHQLGYYCLNFILRNKENNGLIYIGLIVTGVLIVVPLENVFFVCTRLNSNESLLKKNVSYNEVRNRFYSEYDRENPITSKEATEEYLHWIKSSRT